MAQFQKYQSPTNQSGAGAAPAASPARPPRQNPYHDGVSSSAQHYDLFEMIRRPNLSRDNRPPDPPPRELKTKQQRIEEEVEKGFRESRSVPFIATAIKFIFLLLIFPPYILLYRLPKLLLIDWIVALATAIDNKLRAMGQAILDAYERFKNQIKMAFVNFWLLLKATFHKKAKDENEPLSFLAFIAEGIVGFYRLTFYPLYKGAVKGWHLSKWGYKRAKELPMQLHHFVQESTKKSAKFSHLWAKKIKGWLNEAKEAVADWTLRPVDRWIEAKVKRIEQYLRRGWEQLKAKLQAIYHTVRHPIQTAQAIQKASKANYDHLRRLIESKKQQLLNYWLRQKARFNKTIREPLHKAWTWLMDRLENRWAKIRAPFIRLYRRLEPYKAKAKKFITSWLEAPRRWLKQKLDPVKAGYEALKKGWKAVSDRIEEWITQRLEKAKRTLNAFTEPFTWALKNAWEATTAPLRRFSQRFEKRFKALTYRLRRLIAWAHVLSRYGMEMVRGTGDSLFGY